MKRPGRKKRDAITRWRRRVFEDLQDQSRAQERRFEVREDREEK